MSSTSIDPKAKPCAGGDVTPFSDARAGSANHRDDFFAEKADTEIKPSSIVRSVDFAALEGKISATLATGSPPSQEAIKGLADYVYDKILTRRADGMSFYTALKDTHVALDGGSNISFRDHFQRIVGSSTSSNLGWAQWDLTKIDQKKDGNTYKRYFSLASDPKQALRFVNSLGELGARLREVGEEFKTSIDFKIPGNIGALAQHTDSLAIHYYNPAAKDAINATVVKWCQDNGIEQTRRGYLHGIDNENAAHGKVSFGQRLATKMVETIDWSASQKDVATIARSLVAVINANIKDGVEPAKF